MSRLYSLLAGPSGKLSLFLWLIAAHTLGVGITLIFMPPAWMLYFGFGEMTQNFFKVQGGVFHIVVLYAYISAAYDLKNNENMVILSIVTKFIATLFLGIYYIVIDPIVMVGLSGIVDLLMAVILLKLYHDYLNSKKVLPK